MVILGAVIDAAFLPGSGTTPAPGTEPVTPVTPKPNENEKRGFACIPEDIKCVSQQLPPPGSEPKLPEKSGPDGDCLFNPSLPKCKSDNGKCPDGFFQNEDGNCFPQHDKCPKGYHSHENDETGRCIPNSTPCEPGYIVNPSFPECGQKDRICKEHPDAKGCKNDDGKPIPCYQHGILGSDGHDNRCHYPGPPFHPCGFHGFQFIHGKCIKNIFINVHTHTSGGSSGSNNLSDECYDAIKIAWLGKVQRGDSHEVDDFIDNCLNIK